ncbi:MAG: hypothetical protein ACRD08_11240 [Acidimicrobiales bacterium]
MRSACLGAALAAAIVAACGEGRLIYNVDVLSFLSADQGDTVHYLVPAGLSGTVDNPPIEATILDFAGAVAESVTVTVAADVENATGSGQVAFEIFFGADSATLYSTTPYAADTAVVTGVDTVTLAPGPVPFGADTVFSNEKVWIGIRASVVANAGPQPLEGTLRLSQLRLRIVLNDDDVIDL